MLYTFNNLLEKPQQGRILYLLSKSTDFNKEVKDISYHNDEKWLKIWFEDELTEEQIDILNNIINDDIISTSVFEFILGYNYQEFITHGKWKTYQHRVVFGKNFKNIPNITVSNALFIGVSDMDIVNIDIFGFDYTIKGTGGKYQIDLASVSFNWEAFVL
jgi:hypothetical protein